MSRGKVYFLLLGQCTQVLIDKMKQDTDWVAIDTSYDPNLLSKLIKILHSISRTTSAR